MPNLKQAAFSFSLNKRLRVAAYRVADLNDCKNAHARICVDLSSICRILSVVTSVLVILYVCPRSG